MKVDGLLVALLIALLVASAAGVVASRLWMQQSHRQLIKVEKELQQIAEQEQALQMEWISRSDLNLLERRAREELGMKPPRADQWRIEIP